MNANDFLDYRTTVFGQLRRASDRVRLTLMPQALAAGLDTRTALGAFTEAYFRENIFIGQMVGEADRINFENHQASVSFYSSNADDLVGLRKHRAHAVGLEVAHPAFLPVLADWYFERLDRADTQNPELFFQTLTLTDMAYRLTHILKDGTGRAGEDLKVLLARRSGLDLTYSASGYRGALDGIERPIFFCLAAQRIFIREVVARAYAYAGVSPPPQFSVWIRDVLSGFGRRAAANPEACWPSELIADIEDQFRELSDASTLTDPVLSSEHPYRIYAEFLAKETIYFLLCMDDAAVHFPRLTERYRLYTAMHCIDHDQALRRVYLPTPPEIGEHCDQLVAQLERAKIEPGSQNSGDIARWIDQIDETAPVHAQLMRDEWRYGPSEATLNKLRIGLDGVTGEQIRAHLESQLGLAIAPD
ncbi:MAG: hypothetical protein O3A21_05015 [Proteobacteria bacterium]|nr:hypothetical protein [Pseudomonadota bacterium]